MIGIEGYLTEEKLISKRLITNTNGKAGVDSWMSTCNGRLLDFGRMSMIVSLILKVMGVVIDS